jgi:hypothetical protein
MEFPQKAIENETRRPPLAAQARVTRSGVILPELEPFQLWPLGKNLNVLLAVDWTRLLRGRQWSPFARSGRLLRAFESAASTILDGASPLGGGFRKPLRWSVLAKGDRRPR